MIRTVKFNEAVNNYAPMLQAIYRTLRDEGFGKLSAKSVMEEALKVGISNEDLISSNYSNKEYKYLKHIPTQTCYEIMEDGKSIEICGAILQPEVDGKIFWEYTDKYTKKDIVPSDPYANHR